MTESSTPESIDLLMAGYVVGDLTAAELSEFERLLAQQPELAQEVSQLDATCDRVMAGIHEVQPPPHLWTNIRTQIERQSIDRIQPAQQRSVPWGKIWGSLAALSILGLGIDNYRLRQASNMAGEIDALLKHSQTRLFALKSSNPNAASGSFVVNLERQTGILKIQNLPTPPPGYTYRLWAIVDKDKLPCGQVHIDAKGAASEQFSMPADLYDNGITGMFVTLESSQLSRYPTGAAVMQSL